MKVDKLSIVISGVFIALAGCSDPQFGRSVGSTTTSNEKIMGLRAELSRKPDSVSALTGIGREYARQSRWQKASGAYREALIVNPNDRAAILGYSSSQSALGKYESALAHANIALKKKADIPALIAGNIALNGLKRHGEARAMLDKAIAIRPRDLDVRNNIALTLALAHNAQAYAVQRSVAFAPDADLRHKRNFFLVAAMVGQEANARKEGATLGIGKNAVESIFKIGRKARKQGQSAFGIASLL